MRLCVDSYGRYVTEYDLRVEGVEENEVHYNPPNCTTRLTARGWNCDIDKEDATVRCFCGCKGSDGTFHSVQFELRVATRTAILKRWRDGKWQIVSKETLQTGGSVNEYAIELSEEEADENMTIEEAVERRTATAINTEWDRFVKENQISEVVRFTPNIKCSNDEAKSVVTDGNLVPVEFDTSKFDSNRILPGFVPEEYAFTREYEIKEATFTIITKGGKKILYTYDSSDCNAATIRRRMNKIMNCN